MLPAQWLRLLKAPLTDQLPGPALAAHINELYAEKQQSDKLRLSCGQPRDNLHDVIFKSYLRRSACIGVCVCVCVCVCVRACVRASERACVRVCVRACVRAIGKYDWQYDLLV